MFGDIGFAELLIVALVVILVTKPEDLPTMMRRFGILTAHMQRYVQGLWGGWQEKLGLMGAGGVAASQMDATEVPVTPPQEKTGHGR